MTKPWALILVVLSTIGLALAYGSALLPGGAPRWSAWVLAWGTCTMLMALMALGADRRGVAPRRLALPFALVYLILLLVFGLVLWLPPESAEQPALLLGLPRRTALLVYGIGLLPSAILPVAYARTFDRLTLSPDDLERVRQAAQAHREADP